jgi:hypothetical protein
MDNHVHFIAVPQSSDSLAGTFNPDWREYLSEPEDEEIIERLRRCTSTGRPMGSVSFVKEIEGLLGRVLEPHPIGRPGKTKKR